MSLTDASGLSASDVLALTANNDGFGGNGFGGGWWLILFILMLCGGWGGNWGNAGGNGVANMAVPYMMGQNAEVQRGFDQSATMTALNNLSMAVANGFAAQSVDSCNKAMTILQGQNGILNQMANDRFNTITTLNGGHNTILQQMANYEMARQQCCCDNKAAIADLKYTVATENCADRTALDNAVWNLSKQMSDGFQKIIDMNKDQRIADLERQLSQQNLAASQAAQNLAIFANNQQQTDTIMAFLNPPYARAYPPTTAAANAG
jgi:hypothetical protein